MLVGLRKHFFFWLWPIVLILPTASHALSVKSYSYDEYGNLKKVTDPRGLISQYHYDLLNRLEGIDYSDSKRVKYSYDLSDIRRSLEDHHGVTLFEPDTFGRINKVTFPNGDSVSYCYDTEGNLIKMVYPDNTEVEYTYDLSNRLKAVKDPTGVTEFEYDERSNSLKKRTLPNGITTEYLYHPTRKISNVIHKQPDGKLIEEFLYEYDENDNRTKIEKITVAGSSHVIYTYDRLNRVIKADYSDGFFEIFSYDRAGNRQSKTTPTGIISYEYEDADNRLVKAGDKVFVYDPAGNLIKKSSPNRTAIYAYDVNNRLISYSDESNKVIFEYDGDGNRVSKTVNGVCTEYVNDLASPITQVLLKRVRGNWWREAKTIRYIYGGSRISQSAEGKTQFYLYDSLGRNVSSLVSLSGQILNSYEYDAFGGLLSDKQDTPNVYQYCGEQLDEETGLIYLRNRYYDPEIGRFISKDPRPGSLDRPATLNPYCYVENNPVNFIDPLGFDAVNPEEWERVRLHINDLGGWFGGQGAGGHVFLEFPDRNLCKGNYPEGIQSYDQKNINANTATIECYCKPSKVTSGIDVMNQIKWTPNKNCVYTAVEGMKEMEFMHAEKIRLSKILPPPSELRSQMLELNGINPRIITYPREKIEIKHPSPVSPPLSFNFPSSLDFGGVSLSKTAELQLSFADITGVAFDPITGQLVLFGPQNLYLPPVDLDDLAVAVRSVYGIETPYPQDPGVSIDPSPIPGQFQVRYDGATIDTSFGQVMFEADRQLKCLAQGIDNISRQPISANVPGYDSVTNKIVSGRCRAGATVRLWFVPDQIVLMEAEDHKSMIFSDTRMKLLTEAQFGGSPVDDPASLEFAQHFNTHFDDFAKQFPIFEKLKNLGKITAIVKWIKENNISFNVSFFMNYQPKKIETARYTPSIDHYSEQTFTQIERHRVPGHRHRRDVPVEHHRSVTLTGGVSYRLTQGNFTTYVGQAANKFATSALESRPSEQDFVWSFRAPANRETFMAVAQTIYHTRKPGNVKKSYVDMNFPIPNNRSISLERFYNSFSEKETVLGRGWRITPYEIELSSEKVNISSQEGETGKTYKMIVVRTPEGEHLYEPSAFSSDHCLVFKSPHYSGLLKHNSDDTFSLFTPHAGRIDFDGKGRLLSILDNNGSAIEYQYDDHQLVSIHHQNGGTIFLEYDANRLIKASGPGNTSIQYTYHPDGQLWTVGNAKGPYLHHSYDLDKRLKKITDHLENVLFEATYDDYNRATWIKEGTTTYHADFSLEHKTMKIADDQGRESILQYDDKDRLILKQVSGGLAWTFVYEQENVQFPTKIIDPKGGITECHYDLSGNLLYLKNPMGAEWRFVYDLDGILTAYREPNGRAVVNLYNQENQLTQTFFNASLCFDENDLLTSTELRFNEACVTFGYDKETGQLISRENKRRAKTTFTYHRNGEWKEILFPTGYRIGRSIDEQGKVFEIFDELGIQKSYDYDAYNRVKTIQTAARATCFTYDDGGNLKTVVDPRGFTTSYDYDKQHNLKEVTDAEGGISSYEYNSFNQLIHISLPNGSCKTIRYDSFGRLEQEIWGE